MLLLIFLVIHSTWSFQFKFESIRMPRYLIQNSRVSCLLLIARLSLIFFDWEFEMLAFHRSAETHSYNKFTRERVAFKAFKFMRDTCSRTPIYC